jgi:2-oxoisovalerate dehydrogenase E1 component alpha subunit
MPTAVVDGNDPEASYQALQTALHYVRTERKPYLLEAMVSRLRGHSSASGANIVKGEIDCLEKFEATLESRKLIARDQIEQRRAALTQQLLDQSKQIRDEPPPDPSSIWDHVFSAKNLVGGEG